jgi:hypothetical protein
MVIDDYIERLWGSLHILIKERRYFSAQGELELQISKVFIPRRQAGWMFIVVRVLAEFVNKFRHQ